MFPPSNLDKEWQDYCDMVILQFVEIFWLQFLIKFTIFCACVIVDIAGQVTGVNGVVAVYAATATIPFEFLDTCLF